MPPGPQPTLATARLRLRPFTPADAAEVWRLAGERAIADTTANIPHPYALADASAWLAIHAPQWEAGRLANWAITLAQGGELVGAAGLVLEPAFERAELGYWIAVPHWGRGFATEASRAAVEFGFRALGLHRIQARHLVRNPASGRVMIKLGMRAEGVLRHSLRKWGVWEDLALYSVLAHEWPASAVDAGAAPAG